MYPASTERDRELQHILKELSPEVAEQVLHALSLVLAGRMSAKDFGRLGQMMQEARADSLPLVAEMRDCMARMGLPPVQNQSGARRAARVVSPAASRSRERG